MAPAALDVSLAAAGQVETQRAQVDRIWRQRLERAKFAADWQAASTNGGLLTWCGLVLRRE